MLENEDANNSSSSRSGEVVVSTEHAVHRKNNPAPDRHSISIKIMQNIADDSNLSEGPESDQLGSNSEVSVSSCESQALQNLTTQEPKNMFPDDSAQLTS